MSFIGSGAPGSATGTGQAGTITGIDGPSIVWHPAASGIALSSREPSLYRPRAPPVGDIVIDWTNPLLPHNA